ncbi:glutamine synthetase [Oceanirhabdus sp. W0125-5]|uniref:glutamine synthetase n=1 Tax=Oceanirhabdus sp. W0125-5 TaxID=2999116 RepID=UPI0022F2C648|nr:glutamine synthetase [Oceanirhabdus sp. W0125-5]WBW97482.1 glutamine synthetase [Oceanirhabdus sp. W0125-5]
MKDLLYKIPASIHDVGTIKKLLYEHSEIKFISLVGIDLSGHDTDTKIPVKLFLDDLQDFLNGSVQTDGSSVVLPIIATLNNAKIDLVPDLSVDWFVDYNYELVKDGFPVGTLKIPCFLFHDGKAVDSRSILNNSIKALETSIMDMLKDSPEICRDYGFRYEDLSSIFISSATELEFWVKTPNEKAQLDQLSTSQVLKEQYWKKTVGIIRTSLEETLLEMDKYGFEPEMGHKEVGGVKASIDIQGRHTHIMEQLEIDWKYSSALQAADNELFIKSLVKETFRRNGLDVTFLAKPLDGVAGNGKHIHISINAKLKDGQKINLFAPTKHHYMSSIGYGSIMGILKNYEVINPFVTSSYNALKRLKPGYEAPVSIVASLGHTIDTPSRNRTVLLGLVRDVTNPASTRFELRSPNPHSNTYLSLASMNMGMLDGIKYALQANKSEDSLLKELKKSFNESADYLEDDRVYISEEDIFEDYSEEDRKVLFGKTPRTVYECFSSLVNKDNKYSILLDKNVYDNLLIESYTSARLSKWLEDIKGRVIPTHINSLKAMVKVHDYEYSTDYDEDMWDKIVTIKKELVQNTLNTKSLFNRLKEEIEVCNYAAISELEMEMDAKMNEIKELYYAYTSNII